MFWQFDGSKDLGKPFEALSSIKEKEAIRKLKVARRREQHHNPWIFNLPLC